jgi:hypothetical protein
MHDTLAVLLGIHVNFARDGFVPCLVDTQVPLAPRERRIEAGPEGDDVVAPGCLDSSVALARTGATLGDQHVDIAVALRGRDGGAQGRGCHPGAGSCGATGGKPTDEQCA